MQVSCRIKDGTRKWIKSAAPRNSFVFRLHSGKDNEDNQTSNDNERLYSIVSCVNESLPFGSLLNWVQSVKRRTARKPSISCIYPHFAKRLII